MRPHHFNDFLIVYYLRKSRTRIKISLLFFITVPIVKIYESNKTNNKKNPVAVVFLNNYELINDIFATSFIAFLLIDIITYMHVHFLHAMLLMSLIKYRRGGGSP